MNEEIDINSRDGENDKTKQVIVVVEKEKVILIDTCLSDWQYINLLCTIQNDGCMFSIGLHVFNWDRYSINEHLVLTAVEPHV